MFSEIPPPPHLVRPPRCMNSEIPVLKIPRGVQIQKCLISGTPCNGILDFIQVKINFYIFKITRLADTFTSFTVTLDSWKCFYNPYKSASGVPTLKVGARTYYLAKIFLKTA